MSVAFSDLIASASFENGALSLTIPAEWMQGRTTFGGLSTALENRAPNIRSAAILVRTCLSGTRIWKSLSPGVRALRCLIEEASCNLR